MAIWELFIAKKKRVGNSFLEFQQPLQTSWPGQAPCLHPRDWLAAFVFACCVGHDWLGGHQHGPGSLSFGEVSRLSPSPQASLGLMGMP